VQWVSVANAVDERLMPKHLQDAHYRAGRRPLAAMIAALHLYAAPLAAAPAIGQAAPDFALRSLAGENVRLSEHLGDEIYLKYRRAGLVLLSINLDDDPERAAEMAQTLKVSYPVLLDQRKETARAFDVGTLPATILIDRAGDIRYVSDGYKPGYEKRYTERLRELLNE
jgi:peroxiredoxin